ncbi:MAG: hypothetical protein ACI841_000341 [Planctomycetota bacterium]|jgi:hypothetical protein
MIDPAPAPKRKRLKLKITLMLLVTFGLFEAGLRVVLFRSEVGESFDSLRQAHLYARRTSREYFTLKHVLTDPEKRRPTRYDPNLGWTHQRFDSKTYDHPNRDRLGQRRPVLFYGDSFAACVTEPKDCWQGLVAESELSAEFCLMNYGVGGYGFDQTCLLVHDTLELWQGNDPVVVVSLLVDADLDRAALPFFSWPKPDWTIAADGHAQYEAPIIKGNDEWIAANGIGVTSFAWNWFVNGSGLLPGSWVDALSGENAHRTRVESLTRSLLDDLQTELDGRGLEWFVLVFHGLKHFRADDRVAVAADWREPFLLSELDKRGIRYVGSKADLKQSLANDNQNLWSHFVENGPSRRHYTPSGNRAVFETLSRGLMGGADGPHPAR